jgi:membrane peptidoglycan carboxypeptidase
MTKLHFPNHIRYVRVKSRIAAAKGDPFALAESQVSWAINRGMWVFLGLLGFVVLFLTAVFGFEVATGRISAAFFTPWARDMQFRLGPGPSPHIHFPDHGPQDQRRGYTQLPEMGRKLEGKGFSLLDQARFSPAMLSAVRKGLYPTYPEKTQAGIRLLDREGHSIYEVKYPQRSYIDFDSIPPTTVRSLLFIENRRLLDSNHLSLNPAIDWARFGRAVLDYGRKKLGQNVDVSGGSTLATQMEKYRHSDEGITSKPQEKLLQMVSASLRAYQDGSNTLAARRKILLDYVNTVPLAALPGYGEVNGLGDGLLAWYGEPVDTVDKQLLRGAQVLARFQDSTFVPAPEDSAALARMGLDFRKVLHLFIAHRRPSDYLLQRRDALQKIGDSHLRLMAKERWIPQPLRDAALTAAPVLLRRAAPFQPVDFAARKAINGVRARLLDVLHLPRLYDLDRLDLTVTTTLDHSTQNEVSRVLRNLADTQFVRESGLTGFRLLEKGDPKDVIYSFTLYERVGQFNLLRIQADNWDQPLSINEGVKLDLGSTAKLRTLVHYLEIMCQTHDKFAGMSVDSLKWHAAHAHDALTRWSAEWRLTAEDTSLTAQLNESLDRMYSASPKERFYTGGGLHTFSNFDAKDDRSVLTVREGLRNSVNLVFIRMMRDQIQYHLGQNLGARAVFNDSDDAPDRMRYLAQFAEKEGLEFLGGFYRRFRDRDSVPPLDLLFHSMRQSPKRMAAAWKYLYPKASPDSFVKFSRRSLEDSAYPRKTLESALQRVGDASRYSLADWGYLAGVHPLELWLAGYLSAHPKADWAEVREKSREQIQVTYQWLFRTRYRSAQDIRIRTVMENEAFLKIHEAWKRVGYPFPSLVPSLATSIGSSADRPAALAELLGLLQNDGVRRPSIAIKRLHFAEGTPYETVFSRSDSTGEQVLRPELCQVLKPALLDVVEKGTAVRGKGAFALPDGTWIPLGGKTGTGDQRFETFDKRGNALESRVVNRTATFAFFLGDRFFGVLTAHVAGEKAARYGFTSSLPVAILKVLTPALMPLVNAPAAEAGASIYEVSQPATGMADTSLAMGWRP